MAQASQSYIPNAHDFLDRLPSQVHHVVEGPQHSGHRWQEHALSRKVLEVLSCKMARDLQSQGVALKPQAFP